MKPHLPVKRLMMLTIFILVFCSCKRNNFVLSDIKYKQPKILSFSFLSANNNGLLADISGCISQDKKIVYVRNPQLDFKTLTASFELSPGAGLFMGPVELISGKTKNNYSYDSVVTILGADGSSGNYIIRVNSRIRNVDEFLITCPLEDPNTDNILTDFEIRRNGVKVINFDCAHSYSTIGTDSLTDALVYLQTLRALYYLDIGMDNYVPWTPLRLYDWVKSNIQGIDIVDGSTGGSCCRFIDGKNFISVAAQNESGHNYDRTWEGIQGNISLLLHESRHADPGRYYHSSCCGAGLNACDLTYSENDPGAYGVQYWFDKALITGVIDIGIPCLPGTRQSSVLNEIRTGLNINRFCKNAPDEVVQEWKGECICH